MRVGTVSVPARPGQKLSAPRISQVSLLHPVLVDSRYGASCLQSAQVKLRKAEMVDKVEKKVQEKASIYMTAYSLI